MLSPSTLAQQPLPRELIEPRIPAEEVAEPGAEPVRPDVAPESALLEGAGIKFKLRGVRIDGATAYDQQAFASVVEPLIGRELWLEDLRQITSGIEQIYRDGGYLAVRAIVPPQRIRGGSVRILVVEGYVSKIVLRGDLAGSELRIKALLHPLLDSKPLRAADAEEALLAARDTSGVRLVAALRRDPNGAPGSMALVVDATFSHWDGFVSVTNHAPESSGRWVATAGVAFNSFLVSGDRLQVIGLSTLDPGEQLVGQLKYAFPLPGEGWTAYASISNGLSDPGGTLAVFPIDYRSVTASLELDYALMRSRRRSVWLFGGIDLTHQDSFVAGFRNIDEDLRVGFLGVRVLSRELFGGTLEGEVEARLGLDLLGANTRGDPLLSPASSDPQFASVRLDLKYSRALAERVRVRAHTIAQVSTGDLPSLEKLSLGSYTIGRGYDPGSLRGDHGVAQSVELGYRPPFAWREYVNGIELFGFAEGGWVWNGGLYDRLMTAGIGARLTVMEHATLEGTLALPVVEPRARAEGVSLMLRLTGRF